MSPRSNSGLRIAQINAGRGEIATQEIRKVSEELKLDIICIQEPYTRGGAVPGLPVKVRQIHRGEKPMASTIIFNNYIMARERTKILTWQSPIDQFVYSTDWEKYWKG